MKHSMFLLLLLGCPPTAKECPDAADCDTGGDSATTLPDTDTGEPDDGPDSGPFETGWGPDTGVAQMFFVSEFDTRAGEFIGASLGYGMRGLGRDEWVCGLQGTLEYEGPGPEGCPDCDWAFDLGPIVGSVATGAECGDFGLADGGLDGEFDYTWGFSSFYEYDYNGTPYPLENTVFLYDAGAWVAFAFNYGGRNWTYGDAEHLEIVRPVFGSSGGYLYYYYYPY